MAVSTAGYSIRRLPLPHEQPGDCKRGQHDDTPHCHSRDHALPRIAIDYRRLELLPVRLLAFGHCHDSVCRPWQNLLIPG